jgi:hypothetical protein
MQNFISQFHRVPMLEMESASISVLQTQASNVKNNSKLQFFYLIVPVWIRIQDMYG